MEVVFEITKVNLIKLYVLCQSEPRLTFSLKDQAYFLTLHTVFYQHELSGGDDNYKKPPIQLIFHVNRHHPYNRLIDNTLVYLLNENALPCHSIWGSWLNINMLHPEIMNMPIKF